MMLPLGGGLQYLSKRHHRFSSLQKWQIRFQSTIFSARSNPIKLKLQEKLPTEEIPTLSVMPTRLLIRSIMITSILSSPRLLNVCLPLMTKMARSKSPFLNPDQNRLFGGAMRMLFYNHFCAGTNDAEVKTTVAMMKGMGFKGVILGYAKENCIDPAVSREEDAAAANGSEAAGRRAIDEWREGNLRTLPMISGGDFLAIKFTGAGPVSTEALALGRPPPSALLRSIHQICDAAVLQNSRVWIDAEQQVFQPTIDAWTADLMRHYNRNGEAHIYNTFQAYLKSTPTRIRQYLELAQKEDWLLAIKLVRGAYIASEPRHLIHDTKTETDEAYNNIAHNLLSRTFPGIPNNKIPKVQLFLASHNERSVQKAYTAHRSRILAGQPTIELEFGQLQGMADEVSCGLLKLCRQEKADAEVSGLKAQTVDALAPKAFKCLAWGSTRECLQFLVRRAVENRGSMDRAGEWVVGLKRELWRRVRVALGLRKAASP